MNISLLNSEIAVVVLALLLIIFDLLLPRQETRRSLGYVAASGLLGILVFTFTQYGTSATVYLDFFVLDPLALFAKQLFLTATLLTILFSFDYVENLTQNTGEFYALLLFAMLGMMLMASANDLLTMFIGLELMAVVFYALVGFDLESKRSSEAGIKYLILGSASSAVLLYGISWIYGFTGSLVFSRIAAQLAVSPAVLLGLGLMIAGFCFKLSIVPFHMWAPDVYQGAPAPVTALLAMGSKAAAFAVLLRVFLVAFAGLTFYWAPVISVLAALSMVAGIVVAIWQTDIKRMLAYSSIAQAGYILSGLLAANSAGVKGMLFYLVLYMFATAGAFAVAVAVNRHSGSGDIQAFSGLSQQSPLLALVMTVSLLSMAGIPPLAGFAGKMYLFMAIAEQGYLWLVILGFVMSMISVYYYILVVKAMYSHEPEDEREFMVSSPLRLVAVVSLLASLFVGIYPEPLAELANAAALALW
ncbi:NADH-quinone oxidoreductase subunit N|uniref:NADH-quinone oxidoreductase subunit N n=1 Tax=Dendrosporobacter quercicolus TaxID=146817 RepID=A0A1G9W5K9_9FIRM|nr:NADH-quinone oxidoreductase subunit N [Dendrosporobacter quercicolus]NSL47720.1 NADH-quinone oxidoreductase subunit N [Dendrosporobacter quercicolus DSM 1736]SDM79506.1 NADH dehydrogenase subunit N [Dendrosporobacter quercicolus]